MNYRAHAAEMGKPLPKEPLIFLKPPSAVIGDGDAIIRPLEFQKVEFEGELGVVIAARTYRISKPAALSAVAGFSCVNDVTVRDLQHSDGQWARAKGFNTFCPIGPRVVPGLDSTNLRIVTRVNGRVRQDASTSDMVFDVATLVSFCSQYMTLEAGDVISTGTPAGVGNLVPGDVVEVEIEGIGILRNPVTAPS